MRCESFLRRLDSLASNEVASPAMRTHLDRCQACAAEARRLELALSAVRRGVEAESLELEAELPRLEALIEDRVMAAVRLMPLPRQDYFAVRDWIMAGLVIVGSMALIPFGEDFGRITAHFGTRYILPLALVLGLGLTAYGALFIGAHLEAARDFVDRYVEIR